MCIYSNKLTHPYDQVINLYIHRMYFKVLYPINDIKALIFHPIVHQDSKSTQCSCASAFSSQSLDLPESDESLDLPESDEIPLYWHKYIIDILTLEASFLSSNIAS